MCISSFRYKLIVFILLFSGCESVPEQKEEQTTKQEIVETIFPDFPLPKKNYVISKQRKIHSFYKEFLDPDKYNGQFLVAKNGKVIYSIVRGHSDFAKNVEMTSTTPLHVASVSKVATSLAVLRLVDQKKIILDEDVRTYIPEFPYKKISVRMLLNHRSGIPYYGYFSAKNWKVGKTMHNKDVLSLLVKNKFPLNFAPNTKFSYCNTNYALLALIVERVTEKDFNSAMKELVFEPLNMKNSFILMGENMFETVSLSYNSKFEKQAFDYLDAIYGDKNLYTTAYDLLQMDKGTYSNKFISDSLHQQMFKGYSYEHPGKSNYGLGIRLKEEPGKETYFFHTGWWHGNTACYASLRSDTVCIIALSNVYTRSVYKINRLSTSFGNYPFEFDNQK